MATKLPRLAPRGKRAALTRSEMMRRIRSKDTKPERLVRSAVHALGIRFRNDVRQLPARPDLANRSKKWAILVHGCFWHGHAGCRLASTPRSNTGYWDAKLSRNRQRDASNIQQLNNMGYRLLVIWECEAKNSTKLELALSAFFQNMPDSKVDKT